MHHAKTSINTDQKLIEYFKGPNGLNQFEIIVYLVSE